MADTARSQADLIALTPDNTSGDVSNQDLRDMLTSMYQPQGICDGRLTLESGVPVSASDRTGANAQTVYFTPFRGNRVGLYDGTSWKQWAFAELSLALGTLTNGANYDVFLYDSSGTLTLKLGPAWSSDTSRGTGAGTTELDTQDGVYVNKVSITSGPGAKAGRYLGTIRTASTTATEDSAAKRFVWSAQNRVARSLLVTEATSSWTYATASYRQARAQAANQVAVVVGLAGASLLDLVLHQVAASTNAEMAGGIGEDGTSAPVTECVGRYLGQTSGTVIFQAASSLRKYPALGYHYYPWLENALSAITVTFYGAPSSAVRSGLAGSIEA
jgi:hypothetical protein